VLTLDQEAAELLLGFERDLEPRLAAGMGDLAHLAGWAAKLAGATCRLAGLLHLADHLRDGWARPISASALANAIRLADYLIEHARAVFDLMGPTPEWMTPAGCWSGSTAQTKGSSAAVTHMRPPLVAASARPPTSTLPSPCLTSTAGSAVLTPTCPAPRGAGHPRRGSWSTLCTPRQNLQNLQNLTRRPVL
jgi:hypothetical protein